MRRPLVVLVTVLSASLFAFAGSAGAAVTLGSDLAQEPDDGVFCAVACSWIMGALPGRVTEAPSDGVIVRWRIRTDGPGGPFALQVARPAGGNSRLGISVSESTSVAAAGVSEFLTRLPVKQGDNIGIKWTSANTARFHGGAGVPGAAALYFTPALADGESRDANIVNSATEFFVNADLEADADGDGFGDETQDGCPTDATTQGPCDTVGPKLSLKNKRVKRGATSISFTVKSNEIATLSVSGSFKAGKKKFKIKRITRSLAAGSTVTIKVSVPSKAKSKLKSGSTLKGSLTATATDSKGNKSTYTSKPRILPKN